MTTHYVDPTGAYGSPEPPFRQLTPREIAEAIVRGQERACHGFVFSDEPFCSCAPEGHPLCPPCAELATAIETALTNVQPVSWEPIDTAPKDGTVLLLYGCENHRCIWGRGYWFQGVPGDGSGWIASSFFASPHDDMRGSFTPTHWMRLPAPPTSEVNR